MADRGALQRHSAVSISNYVKTWLALCLAGLASEIAQWFTGRDASLLDLANDAVGTTLTLGVLALWRREPFAVRRWSALSIVVILCLAALWVVVPIAWTAAAYAQRRLQMPMLWQYHSPLDLYFLSRPDRNITPVSMAQCDAKSLSVKLGARRYPGLRLYEPYPDWRGYHYLQIHLTNPGPLPVPLTVRVHDASHNNQYDDRYNQVLQLAPESNMTVRIALADIERAPVHRILDMAHVAGISIFRAKPAPIAGFCLRAIRLT